MKLIIVDFLRRWWGAYLLAVLFVGAMAAAMDLEASFTFLGVLMLPFVFELGRGPLGVMTTLPVSRRGIALTYWRVAVLLPVVLMAGIIALNALLFRSFIVSPKIAAMILFGSLAFAGSCFCLFTFISPKEEDGEGNPGNLLFLCLGMLWFCSIVFGKFLNVTTQSPVVYPMLTAGLLLTVWGYSRCERLLYGRATKYPAAGQISAQARQRTPSVKPDTAPFGRFLFDTLGRGFLAGLLFSILLLVFKTGVNQDASAWPLVFTFGGLGSMRLLCEAMRFLRCLPLSARRLALTLLFMPLFSILAIIAGMAIIKWFNPTRFSIHYSTSLMIPMAGAICFASSFFVRFGRNGYLLSMMLGLLASTVICNTVADTTWLAAFWWLLGLSLMVAAFFLNRHWLRSSDSYRSSTGDFMRSHR